MKELVIFDVDGTIIKGQSQRLLVSFFYKKRYISFLFYFRIVFNLVLYKAGLLKDPTPVMEFAYAIYKGKNFQEVNDIMEDFYESILKFQIYPGARDLIRDHIEAGREVVLVSNSTSPFIQVLAQHLGVTKFFSTNLGMKDGLYTGKINGAIMYGDEKVVAVQKYLLLNNIRFEDVWGYGDHESDLPLLKKVGHAFVVNPTPGLRKEASIQNWPIITFNL